MYTFPFLERITLKFIYLFYAEFIDGGGLAFIKMQFFNDAFAQSAVAALTQHNYPGVQKITGGLVFAVLLKTLVIRPDTDYSGTFIENFDSGGPLKHHHLVLLSDFRKPPCKSGER